MPDNFAHQGESAGSRWVDKFTLEKRKKEITSTQRKKEIASTR
jgi:hypothetical protein